MARRGCCRCNGMGNLRSRASASNVCSTCLGEVCDRHLVYVDGLPYCTADVPSGREKDAIAVGR